MIRKEIHNQDSYFKLNEVHSGETSLNISLDILSLISPTLHKGDEATISFEIHKEDYVNAIAYIAGKLPVFTSTSSDSSIVRPSISFFEKGIKEITSLFGNNGTATYTIKILYRNDGRVYLKNLDHNGFNIRHFLLAENSVLEFENLGGNLTIRLRSEPCNYIIREKKANSFGVAVCKYFWDYDRFTKLKKYFVSSSKGTNFTQIELDGQILYRFLNPNLSDATSSKWDNTPYELDGVPYLFCREWTENDNSSSIPSIAVLKYLIEKLYPSFTISKEDSYFVLRILPKLQTTSSDIPTYKFNKNFPLQQIYFGAPGTGKSFTLEKETKGCNVFRTTFHPDTDYASFVGCYKPTERGGILKQTVWDFASKTAMEIPVMDINGKPVIDRSITYRYVPQVFVNAYVRAWNLLGKVTTSAASTTASPAITIPSFTASSCYSGKCAKGASGLFDCIGVEKLNEDECNDLADVEAFNFPFEGYSSIGDLRNKKAVEVEIVDKPSDKQIETKSREVTYTRKEVEAELKTLKDLIEYHRSSLMDKYGDYIFIAIQRLQGILDEMDEENELTRTEAPQKLLGLYDPTENKVYLFKNNIGNDISLLVGTFIHEIFHAYFREQNYILEIEEAIVEGATLCFLEQYDVKLAEDYRWQVVSMCGTASSFYGFGIELYERRSEDWAADYIHAPRIDANDPKVRKFRESFHLGYPFGRDEELIKLLYTILKSSPATAAAGEHGITNNEAVVLVIEEINRGNCAQIFGDLFQLLDRKDGWSEYPIKAEEDLRRYLESAKDEAGNDILINKDGIKNGMLCLPPNLYIWATMNTSDQSLFPMDSAFKRRWDWRFFAIKDEKKGHKIKRSTGTDYDWWEIISTLNAKILNITQSADKQMGYFFMKPVDGKTISAEEFVSKVIFYLWNDIFKDYSLDDENNPFADDMRFEDFYTSDGKVKVSVLERFLDNIKKEYDSLHPVKVETGTEAEKEETEEATPELSTEEVTEVTEVTE